MALDELYEQLRKLREDISEFSEYLEANETGTRQVLIDPLLRVLGWEVADPTQVRLEFGISKLDGGKKVADYVLIQDEKPVAVVEAKKLNTKNLEAAIGAAMVEAVERGIKYILVTDGDRWRVYDVFKEAAIDKKLVVEFSVVSDPLSVSAVNALVIWRPNIANQGGPTVPERLLFCKDDKPDDPDCVPLPKLQPKGQKPVRVKLHNGGKIEVGNFARVIAEVAKALVRDRKLTTEMCPVMLKESSVVCIVNDRPQRPDGTDFKVPVAIGEGLWLETFGAADANMEKCKVLLEACGVDTGDVCVELAKT